MEMRGPKGNLTYLGTGHFRISRRDDKRVIKLDPDVNQSFKAVGDVCFVLLLPVRVRITTAGHRPRETQ